MITGRLSSVPNIVRGTVVSGCHNVENTGQEDVDSRRNRSRSSSLNLPRLTDRQEVDIRRNRRRRSSLNLPRLIDRQEVDSRRNRRRRSLFDTLQQTNLQLESNNLNKLDNQQKATGQKIRRFQVGQTDENRFCFELKLRLFVIFLLVVVVIVLGVSGHLRALERRYKEDHRRIVVNDISMELEIRNCVGESLVAGRLTRDRDGHNAKDINVNQHQPDRPGRHSEDCSNLEAEEQTCWLWRGKKRLGITGATNKSAVCYWVALTSFTPFESMYSCFSIVNDTWNKTSSCFRPIPEPESVKHVHVVGRVHDVKNHSNNMLNLATDCWISGKGTMSLMYTIEVNTSSAFVSSGHAVCLRTVYNSSCSGNISEHYLKQTYIICLKKTITCS